MRFLRLDLLAFGPFTKASLDFSSTGLHLVYGPNEAGKTTARRAVRTALFGFRTKPVEFDFRHDKTALRVGLAIEDSLGRQSSFIRRRGNKNDLLDADGQTPLENDPVSPLLASVGLVGDQRETHFERAFAIGEAELRLGGQEILAGKGDLSELLFMSAAGLPRLRAVEREFATAADALFLPSGRKPPINEAILRWKSLQEAAQQKSLPPTEFVRHTGGLQQATIARDRLEAALTDLRRRKATLERIRHSLHPAARLRERTAELAEVRDAPLLREDFAESHRRIEAERQLVSLRRSGLEAELRQIASRLAENDVPDDLLAAAATIERLYKRLGSYEQVLADIPQRHAELAHFEAEAGSTLRNIRPDLELGDADSLRLTLQERETILELARRRGELVAARKKDEERRRKQLNDISEAAGELKQLGPEPVTEHLRAACRQSERDGDLDAASDAARAEADRLHRQCTAACAGLSNWEGQIQELEHVPVPSIATLDRFDSEFAAIASEAARLAERREETARTLEAAEQALSRLVRDGDVPTEDALRTAREQRDVIWREIRDTLGPAATRTIAADDKGRLVTSFEFASKSADDAADRLRREAARTQQLLNLSEDRDRRSTALEKLALAETELRHRREVLASEWGACWPFLTAAPRTPREMREWIARRDALLRVYEQQQLAETRADDLARRRAEFRRELIKALAEAGAAIDESLPTTHIVEQAVQLLSACDDKIERRKHLKATSERARKDIAEIEAAAFSERTELEEIERVWSDKMTLLGLATGTSAKAAEAFLSGTDAIFERLDKAAALRERLGQMNLHREDFVREMKKAVGRLAPDLAEVPAEVAAIRLNERLIEARTLRDRRKELVERHDERTAELATVQGRSEEIAAELADLCREAGCVEAAELLAIEERSLRRRTLEGEIAETEDELRFQCGGRSLDDLFREIDETDIDSIGPELERIEAEIKLLGVKSRSESDDIVRHEQALSAMQGDSAAADALEDAEAVLATLAADVERYAKLRLAARLLREGRERYRQKSGNDVLEHASRLFAQLTCGAFEGLTVDFGDNDEPTLFGVRSGTGEAVPTGGMSDGTADQLYLALRLAGLHAWLDKHEPMPFVVDDLLIHFDDQRAAAALAALADLSERTQVLFFTHHRHLVQIATDTLSPKRFQLHDLAQVRRDEAAETLSNPELVTASTQKARAKPSLF